MKYILSAGAKNEGGNKPELVSYVSEKFREKQMIWYQRWCVIADLQEKLRFLLSVYDENQGNLPKSPKSKKLHYKSVLAHQANNLLQGSKLCPDFIDYAPLGIEHDRDLFYTTDALTRAHKALRYQGLFPKAQSDAKKDLIWGNSFIELVLNFNPDGSIRGSEYQHAPFFEMRNFYGEPDRLRVINYSPESYAKEYGEEELEDVAEGGIVANDEIDKKYEMVFKVPRGNIQVLRYYNPARKIFAEIHGGNGKIYQNLEGENYPLSGRDNDGFDPFLESRFYEDPTDDWFGWGVMDFLVGFANLDTTITNAVSSDAIWSASAPVMIESNDPDKMRSSLRKWENNRDRGLNRVQVEKNSGMGLKGNVTDLSRPVRTDLMNTFDETIISRATRGSNLDFQALSEYAPTAEQQKMKKIEADKLNLRVLMLNEQREIDFAKKEMYFLKNTKTPFHNYKIEVDDEVAKKYQGPDGFRPMQKKKVWEILDGMDKLQLKISPRLEGALDDMTFVEIQEMQEDIGLMPQGTQAQIIALEKYISKKNPNWGLTREDFMTPAPPAPDSEQPDQPPAGVMDKTAQQLVSA